MCSEERGFGPSQRTLHNSQGVIVQGACEAEAI